MTLVPLDALRAEEGSGWVADRLTGPYCYGGNNDLTAYYYDWQKLGDYFFARFKWLTGHEISGFTFLKLTSANVLQGAWWYDDEAAERPSQPPAGSGKSVIWRRVQKDKTPAWATKFVERLRQGEVPRYRWPSAPFIDAFCAEWDSSQSRPQRVYHLHRAIALPM